MTSSLRLTVIILVGLARLTSAQAAPQWTIDLKSLGVPGPPRPMPEFTDRALRIGFTTSNQILVNFVLSKTNGELNARQSPAILVELVALLLDPASGKLIRRQEWTTEATPTPRIVRLAGGGFVLLLGNRLQILDGSLTPVREKTLDLTGSAKTACRGPRCPKGTYDFDAPVKGRWFGVEYLALEPYSHTAQIIDSETLTIAEEWEVGHDWSRTELYEDLLIAGKRGSPQMKRIGQVWRPMGVNLRHMIWLPHFLRPDLVAGVATDLMSFGHQCWFETDLTTILGKPICYLDSDIIGALESSQDGSIIAVGIGRRPTGFAALLDLNGAGRVIVYTQGTHRKVLSIPPREAGEHFELSLDGTFLAILRGEKLSLYAVPHP